MSVKQALSLPRAALFDLDGTLVDTAPDLADAVNDTLAELGMARWPEEQMRAWIGGGMDCLVERALAATVNGTGVTETLREQAVATSLKRYRANLTRRSRPFPGTVATLRYLQAAGVRLACVTNKRATFTNPLLEALELAAYFETVVCGDTLAQMKPHPAPLLHALDNLGIPPGKAIMIGDSENDVAAARAAGMQVVCVSYGYSGGRDIREAGSDAVVSSMDSLRELFAA